MSGGRVLQSRLPSIASPSMSLLTMSLSSMSRSAQARVWRLAANGQDHPDQEESDGRAAVLTRTRPLTRKPNMYRVLLLNDDYTPMDFVVTVLLRYFGKSPDDAYRIMLTVHQKGVGECGVYTYEVAETKVTQVMDYARKNQHPLQCVMEKT